MLALPAATLVLAAAHGLCRALLGGAATGPAIAGGAALFVATSAIAGGNGTNATFTA